MGAMMQAMGMSLKDTALKPTPTQQSEEEKRIRISAAESKRERRRIKRLATIPRAGS
jgi:hypothetical protein